MTKLENFRKIRANVEDDIRNLVNAQRGKEVAKNRAIMRPIIDTVITCGRQNIALRGHRNEKGNLHSDPKCTVKNIYNSTCIILTCYHYNQIPLPHNLDSTKACFLTIQLL